MAEVGRFHSSFKRNRREYTRPNDLVVSPRLPGYHVALHRSIGDAALRARNSESIVKRHYLNTHTQEEGSAFFRSVPDLAARKTTLFAQPVPVAKKHLKVV